jgi:hypothetical protein
LVIIFCDSLVHAVGLEKERTDEIVALPGQYYSYKEESNCHGFVGLAAVLGAPLDVIIWPHA